MILSNKRGIQWEILASFILGLIVVSIVLFWLFQEYFTEADLDWEVCRQSIIIRNNVPDVTSKDLTGGLVKGYTVTSFKNKFPLKCETQVITITEDNVRDAPRLIMDAMAQSWYLFGEGKYQIYPSALIGGDSYCMGAVRVHFYSGLKGSFPMKWAFDQKMDNGQTYRDYLTQNGDDNAIIRDNRFAPDLDVSYYAKSWLYDAIKVKLPEIIDYSKGDLFIVPIQFIVRDKETNTHLFYFQDMDGHNFKKLESPLIRWPHKDSAQKLCNNWEGIPA